MTLPLTFGFIWLILANVIVLLPGRWQDWRAAYALTALGIPLLGWVTWSCGPLWGLLFLVVGTIVLRWPLARLWGRFKRPAR